MITGRTDFAGTGIFAVRMIDEKPPDVERMELPQLMVELVGVAGAGKSSLSRGLIQSDGRFVQGANLEVRKLRHMPFFFMNSIFLLPNLLRGSLSGRWFTWQEIKMMVYLQGWHHVLERRSSSDRVVVLDQGPVFQLAWLRHYDPGNFGSPDLGAWWDEMLRRWATRLDLVIWLDAPDATLLSRIRGRTSWHVLKDMSEQEGLRFLAGFRRSYEEVITKFAAMGGPKVIRLNSNQNSSREILDQALTHLGRWKPIEVASSRLK